MTEAGLVRSARSAEQRERGSTLFGARCRRAFSMIQSFVGEAIGDPQLEAEGTAAELLCRAQIERLQRARRQKTEEDAAIGTSVACALDVDLHEQAASWFEGAARHHREAARCYHAGDEERARYHATAAQALCMDIASLTVKVGRSLWRSMKRRD